MNQKSGLLPINCFIFQTILNLNNFHFGLLYVFDALELDQIISSPDFCYYSCIHGRHSSGQRAARKGKRRRRACDHVGELLYWRECYD